MPETGVYLVSPRSIAAMAASLTLSGVSKSGSPTERLMTSRPGALRSRAFCVMTIVADGLMRERASDKKPMGILRVGALEGRLPDGGADPRRRSRPATASRESRQAQDRPTPATGF